MKKNELTKRFGSFLLSGVLVISASVSVMATPDQNSVSKPVDYSVISENAVNPDSIQETADPDPSESDFSITSPVEEAESVTETDVSDPEAAEDVTDDVSEDGDLTQSEEVTEEIGLAGDELPDQMVMEDKNGDEKTITVLVKNPSKASTGEKYLLAVWSDDKGQDDIVWYEPAFSAGDSAYKTEIPIAAHKSVGTFHAHLYLRTTNGSMVFKGKDTFEIHPVQAQSIEVTDLNNDQGTATVTLTGVSSPSGVNEVLFPVWSQPDQSDIVWYAGKKVSDGIYQITLDISRHSFNYGTYQIHTYGKNGCNVQSFLQKTTCSFTRGEKSLEAIKKDSDYTLEARNLDTTGIKEYSIAVWSARNGQDDLKWYTVKANTQGSASVAWIPDEYGMYAIHCYARTTDGKMVFQKGIETVVEGASIEKTTVVTDNKTGTFTITIDGAKLPVSGSKLLIPVWADAKQADLLWYQAAKQADGSYSITSNISKHGNRTGEYHAHVYVQEPSGKLAILDEQTFTISGQADSITAELNSEQTTCTLTATGIVCPQKVDHMSFAVWSEKNGQDDLKWYDAPLNTGTSTASVSIANHKTDGTYQVHLYAVTSTGARIFMAKTTFNVDLTTQAEVTYSDRDEENASFKVQISLNSDAAVKAVKVPVWCSNNQSDIVWYDAVKEADGTWSVTVKAQNHAYHLGTYKVHAYVDFENQIRAIAATSSYTLDMKDYLTVVNKGTGHRQVILSNPSASYKKVTFPTWSDEEGQNDLIWYNGVKQADGNWVADIYAGNHDGHPGTYEVHCYADDKMAGKTTITFAENEMIPIGEQKVKQYVQQILNVTGRDLRSVYLWCVNNINYEKLEIPQNHPEGTTRQQYYFIYAYEHRTGNCFSYAATFYYCALELGYNAKLVEGRYLRSDGTHGVHGWVEIYQNGVPYVCDPEIAWQSMHYDTYMRPYGSTALTYFRNEAAY